MLKIAARALAVGLAALWTGAASADPFEITYSVGGTLRTQPDTLLGNPQGSFAGNLSGTFTLEYDPQFSIGPLTFNSVTLVAADITTTKVGVYGGVEYTYNGSNNSGNSTANTSGLGTAFTLPDPYFSLSTKSSSMYGPGNRVQIDWAYYLIPGQDIPLTSTPITSASTEALTPGSSDPAGGTYQSNADPHYSYLNVGTLAIVPEPSSIALAGSALAIVLGVARFRRDRAVK